ncbi:16S rRNA (adenine1518-N6/adenine1519-N6)-dimethyltransferase [Williamsoniiplasma somnilux]|uniref:Ribosomal RNA small subunit methyltransferase A n=1 Tax=Williamsoniiplasma somnilux TaxID=215578 RepID=A0A2K8NX27_9MOLU|nr:16S rRNA (adenine(1518)-N(6)/adenine(1519)-N(6))-dimethyltransferase RsmA [Williamsoniiplasma somnilux]ATZ18392.1 16S rRNA (adenine1518-N6/adenine1519-N6)-dimethyltransferase [Williamsoniiplasma somnilux]
MEIRAKKHFGQNFISDENLINKIVDTLGFDKDMLIIEIGPGTGALTQKLVNRFERVVAIEIDKDMEKILKAKITNDNFKFILGDVLEIDFNKIIEENKIYPKQKVALISNMPYYITGEILFKTLNLSKELTKAVFMMQKEVATRVCAKKGENNYNNLSVAAEFYADKKYEFTVKKAMFRPIPKVDSAIISLTFKNENLTKVDSDKKFVEFVRKLFNNRRKTILNNLTSITGDKTFAAEILTKANIQNNLRPEVISLAGFIEIYNNKQK